MAGNEERPPTEMLREAARLVEGALAQMDGSWRPCRCCRLKLYNNPLESRVLDRLGPMVARLHELASDLEEGKRQGDRARRDRREEEERHGDDRAV